MAEEPAMVQDSEVCSGQWRLRGTRFPMSRLLAEIADSDDAWGIADEFDLDPVIVREALRQLAKGFEDKRIELRPLYDPDITPAVLVNKGEVRTPFIIDFEEE